MYYEGVWGVGELRVKVAESGELIRFNYRVLDPGKAAALNDKKAEPELFDRAGQSQAHGSSDGEGRKTAPEQHAKSGHDLLDGFLEPDAGGETRPPGGCGHRLIPGNQPRRGMRPIADLALEPSFCGNPDVSLSLARNARFCSKNNPNSRKRCL